MASSRKCLIRKEKPDEVKLFRLPAVSNGYFMLKTLGSGTYGIVHQCFKIDTMELVAMKIVSNDYGKKELDNLTALRKLGQGNHNLVKFNGHHKYGDKLLLEFENLDMTLDDWVRMSGNKGRPLSEIQVITKQLLVALNALKSLSLVHTDIKPNNIMLVDHQLQPCKVKLIDFGMAAPVSKLKIGHSLQIVGFRAPEVLLGLPLNEAVDMWGLGCILAYLYLGTYLYKLGSCKYQALKNLVQINGQPNETLLNSGKYTDMFFTQVKLIKCNLWKLKEQCMCKECTVSQKKLKAFWKIIKGQRTASYTCQKSRQFASLDEIVLTRRDVAKTEDTQAFLSLLKQMLHFSGEERITPSEALQHPFMTLKHFPSESAPNPDNFFKRWLFSPFCSSVNVAD